MDVLKSAVHTQKYLFHLHTSFTDGASTVAEYCAYADAYGYTVLIFTEHVCRNLDYDWLMYLSAIERARMTWPGLEIWCGCEAKVLLDGTLDMPEHLPGLDLVCMAEHGDYGDRGRWKRALLEVLNLHVGLPRVWVHPFRWIVAQGHDVGDDVAMRFLVQQAIEAGVLLETMSERKRRLLDLSQKLGGWRLDVDIVDAVDKEHLIRGCDAHSVKDLD